LELLAIRREIARLEGDLGAGRPVPAVEVVSESRAWRDKGTRVSVIVPLYNHERHIVAALWSIAQSRYSDVEVIVVDDGSTDGSLTAVRHFLAQHEGLPMLVIRHPINRGLAHARNTAIDFARGEFAFMLDADNEIYVNAIRRLVEAADADDGAAFAYGMLAMFSDSGPSGLRSQYPWQPERLRTGNYIDAMALWRLSALRRLGGYGTDPRLHGWEDYDLWCRAAEADHRGAFVPEVVARYRVSMHSMLSITNLSAQTVVSLIIERSPRLFAGVEPPL
jgi:glycosyltransferase involved in cell wall biosynthesis